MTAVKLAHSHGGTQVPCSQVASLTVLIDRIHCLLIISCHGSFELLRKTLICECKIAKEAAFYSHLFFFFFGSSLSLNNIHNDDLFPYKVAEMH